MAEYMQEGQVMSVVDDLIAAGYTGYAGWSPTEAAADYKATGGAGKTGGGGGGGGGGYSPVSAPDLANLQSQVYNVVNPYYQQLAIQAKGDFNTAVQMMQTDYQQGVKQAKETLALTNKYGQGDLQNTLSQLGLTFNNENQNNTDALNKRGMAVYQNNPNGTPNAVQPASFTPTYDVNNYTFGSGVSGANPNLANLGQGGTETEQLRQSQALRAEAAARAGMKPLEQAGLSFKQYSNPNAGYDPSNPAKSTQGTDLSQLGTAELGELGNYNTQSQQYRNTAQNLANQQRQDVNNLASQYASLGTKSLDANLTGQLNKQYTTNFVTNGT